MVDSKERQWRRRESVDGGPEEKKEERKGVDGLHLPLRTKKVILNSAIKQNSPIAPFYSHRQSTSLSYI
jgi:ribosomal protein L39E